MYTIISASSAMAFILCQSSTYVRVDKEGLVGKEHFLALLAARGACRLSPPTASTVPSLRSPAAHRCQQHPTFLTPRAYDGGTLIIRDLALRPNLSVQKLSSPASCDTEGHTDWVAIHGMERVSLWHLGREGRLLR